MPNELENVFREAAKEALADLKGLGQQSKDVLLNRYAPQFAELTQLSPADAKEVYEALILNLEIDGDVIAIDGQAAGNRAVFRVLKGLLAVAANVAIP